MPLVFLTEACYLSPSIFFPKQIFKERGVKSLTSALSLRFFFCNNWNKDAFKTNILFTARLHRLRQLLPLPLQPRVNIDIFSSQFIKIHFVL